MAQMAQLRCYTILLFCQCVTPIILQLARELDIFVNQTSIKSVAVQRLQPKNKNYGFHRGWGLSGKILLIYSQNLLEKFPISPQQQGLCAKTARI